MKISRLLAVCLCAITSLSADARADQFFDNRFSVEIPEILVRMTDEQIKLKFPFGNAPPVAFMDETTRISLAIQKTPHPEKGVTADRFKDMMRTMLPRLRPVKEWLTDDVVLVDDKEVGRLALVTPVMESDDYDVANFMFFVVGKKEVFMINMNCTTDRVAICEDVVTSIQDSIRLQE